MKLYEIESEYRQIAEELLALEGELTPEIEERLDITQDQFERKGLAYAKAIAEIDLEADTLRDHIRALQKRLKAKERSADALRSRLATAMSLFGVDKLRDTFGSVSLRRTESVNVFDVDLLPGQFVEEKIVRKADLAAVKQGILDGELTEDQAVIVQNQHVRINF